MYPRSAPVELKFWLDNVSRLNIKLLFSYETPKVVSHSDASSLACGAIMSSCDHVVAHRMWSQEEREKSSTWRELNAIHFSLEFFLPMLKGRSVHWFTDNQSVVSIVNSGSMKPHLHEIALDIFSTCLRNNISLFPEWVPRERNTRADSISKIIDYDDWKTSEAFFSRIDARWGPFTVDRFASSTNRECHRFNSLLWNPGAEQVNAFSVSWVGENNWLVPPIFLISKAILHLLTCKAKGVLIVTCWPSAPFGPLIFVKKFFTHSFVTDMMVFDDPIGIFELGDYPGSLLGSNKFTSPVLALLLDGSI